MHKKSVRIYLIDDDLFSLNYYQAILHGLNYHDVETISSSKELLEKMPQPLPHIIFLDYNLNAGNCLHLLLKIKVVNPAAYVIILSGQKEVKTAVSLINAGAFDYIEKGNNDIEAIEEVLKRVASHKKHLQKNNSNISLRKIVANVKKDIKAEIANNLHDNITPLLVASNLFLEAAMLNEDMRLDMLKETKSIILTVVDELRTFSYQLAEKNKISGDIETSLNNFLYPFLKLDNVQFKVMADIEGLNLRLAKIKQSNFLSIVRELVNNSIKYSHALTITVKIQQYQRHIMLDIADNGVGFDMENIKAGIGLRSVKERIKKMKGEFIVTSSVGKGCRWQITIPAIRKS